mmetsp:Transcript_34390/g.76382  ORF Transcript_34390/g.76382 Transcript_34390/m.76382 type:complete len:304 (-) Transcript_34390:762-1673(-)
MAFGLRSLRSFAPNALISTITPANVPVDVCKATLEHVLQVLVRAKQLMYTTEEASKVLHWGQMIRALLEVCGVSTAMMLASSPSSESMLVETFGTGTAATSSFARLDADEQVVRQGAIRMPRVPDGCIELQVQRICGPQAYLLGACEVADFLTTHQQLEAKVQHCLKEAVVLWWENACRGVFEPVKMIMTDGEYFMMVMYRSETSKEGFERKMPFHKYRGTFSASKVYRIWDPSDVDHPDEDDGLDAIRMLLGWLHPDPTTLTTEGVKGAIAEAAAAVATKVRKQMQFLDKAEERESKKQRTS